MGSSIFDYFNGTYSPTQQQASEAADWASLNGGNAAAGAAYVQNRDMSNLDNLPTTQQAAKDYGEYRSQTAPTISSMWNLNNLNSYQPLAGAPSYDANGLVNLEGGKVGVGGNTDQALQTTLNAAGAGNIMHGVAAFGGDGSFTSLTDLAQRLGLDTGGYTNTAGLRSYLDSQLQDYYNIGGLSQGWNDTGNARGANTTLYRRVDGRLVPLQTQNYTAREQGSWLEEHPGILAPLAVAGAGLAAGALGAGSAAGTGTAAASSGASGGIGGTVANTLGLGSQWAALPSYAQSAITGAGMGGISSGLQGGNILQGMLTGALSGGVGGGVTSGLGQAGLNSTLASGLGRAAGGVAAGLANGNTDLGSILMNSAMNTGTGYLTNSLGLGSGVPTDNSLGAILTRMAAQQGGSYLAQQIDPRLRGLGGTAGGSLANLLYRT